MERYTAKQIKDALKALEESGDVLSADVKKKVQYAHLVVDRADNQTPMFLTSNCAFLKPYIKEPIVGNDICLLITLFYTGQDQLIQCALKANRDSFDGDCLDYPMEPENRNQIMNMLPAHVRSIGPIVKVESIFEITVDNTMGNR